MNAGSVMAWFDYESALDTRRNLLTCPPELRLERSPGVMITLPLIQPPPRAEWGGGETPRTLHGHRKLFAEMTIALIAHDEMKTRMIEFVTDHERELNKFGTILATGTTGREVAAATSREIDKKMVRHHSGPKGGDIEIATAILYGFCDVVIFFVDPLKPHPHIEDIRVVFQACMVSDQVVMITNEMHAREFMSRVVRGNGSLALYYPDKPLGNG
jgi:methylglyoxal synthase